MTAAPALLPCQECGMECTPNEYHPYAACLMFKGCHNSETVRANLLSRAATTQASIASYRVDEDGSFQFAIADDIPRVKEWTPLYGEAHSQPVAPVVADASVAWNIEVVPVIVRDVTDAHYVRFSVGCQHFHMGPDYLDTREDAQWFATQLDTALRRAKAPVTDEMVQRFLGWKLPETFAPDCYISFDREGMKRMGNGTHWPVGTNLLNDPEARAMLEYVLAAPHPAQPQEREPRAEDFWEAAQQILSEPDRKWIEARAREMARK